MLILQGSARQDGNTAAAVAQLQDRLTNSAERVDLAGLNIRSFDYRSGALGDAFDGIVERMLAHPSLLFATPVYWYAMSGLMKTLFDRFSNLLSDRDVERRGRRLAGREMWMLSVGTDPEMPHGFETPFASTADYLGMVWRGACYVSSRGLAGGAGALDDLAERINRSAQ